MVRGSKSIYIYILEKFLSDSFRLIPKSVSETISPDVNSIRNSEKFYPS